MPRTLLWFAYEGPLFDGYARQQDPGLRTVEGALLDAFVRRGVVQSREEAGLRSGSRTDRGVSARRNACTLDATIPGDRVAPALGTTVPGLWPLASVEVEDGFDARRAVSRTYLYHLPAAWLPPGTNARQLQQVGRRFVGRHDFRAFARLESGKDPMRTVTHVEVREAPGMFVVEVGGPSFLWRQVRRMVAAMVAVCRAEVDERVIAAALEDPASAPDLGQAPAAPLVLWDVSYRDVAPPRPVGAHRRLLEQGWPAPWAESWARGMTLRHLLD